jgi:hypothetical protein
VNRETLVVMQAERFTSGWDSWVIRGAVDEMPVSPSARAPVEHGSERDQLKAR